MTLSLLADVTEDEVSEAVDADSERYFWILVFSFVTILGFSLATVSYARFVISVHYYCSFLVFVISVCY